MVKNATLLPATQYLLSQIEQILKKANRNNGTSPRILNIGAGWHLVIEKRLTSRNCNYICDRVDIDDCKLDHPSVDKCWQCSVESMSQVESNTYDVVLASWLLEHIEDLCSASKEIFRVLKPSAMFITTVPNVNSPEFCLARITPLWFHKILRRRATFEKHYSYSSIYNLIEIFESAGFIVHEVKAFPCVESYLKNITPILGFLGKIYDSVVSSMKIKILMGHVCIVFDKPQDSVTAV